MATILNAFRRTTTDALGTVSAVTSTVTNAAEAVAYIAESGTLRAKAYRDATEAEIAENAGSRQILRVNAAKFEVASQLRDLKAELDADPELAAIFNNISDDLFTPSSHLSVAAE